MVLKTSLTRLFALAFFFRRFFFQLLSEFLSNWGNYLPVFNLFCHGSPHLFFPSQDRRLSAPLVPLFLCSSIRLPPRFAAFFKALVMLVGVPLRHRWTHVS